MEIVGNPDPRQKIWWYALPQQPACGGCRAGVHKVGSGGPKILDKLKSHGQILKKIIYK